ncbi:hypothetical protein [Isoptericola haloaureus]|uniref:Sulfotransferase family protein n=1 Tax=Isoptericola haloaureus TaxID=1542902 RepID=A0ABU7Z599_9MICO
MHQISSDPNATPNATSETASKRRIVFVAGSGRSGTSTLSGILKELGMRVPVPEVTPDETNPKGFGESQWVVDLHNRLLRQANVQVSDARPQAWFEAGRLATNDNLRHEISTWLDRQFGDADELVVKDPRLSWFLGLWRVAAMRSGTEATFATMLRPPTEVIGSKAKYYGRRGTVDGIAAWVNMMLHTERATRGSKRVFVRYHDLLDDWTVPVNGLGEIFDIQAVKTATPSSILRVHEFVDPNLRRVQITWDSLSVPRQLQALAQDTWEQLNKLADPDGDNEKTHAELDVLLDEYTAFYEDSEAIAASTALASLNQGRREGRRGARKRGGVPRYRRVANRIPHSLRAKIPASARRRVGGVVRKVAGGSR